MPRLIVVAARIPEGDVALLDYVAHERRCSRAHVVAQLILDGMQTLRLAPTSTPPKLLER